MLVELQRFVEFKEGYFHVNSRDMMLFEPMTINTDYVAWVRRCTLSGFDFCEVHMADRGGNFTFDKTYEEMKAVLLSAERMEPS